MKMNICCRIEMSSWEEAVSSWMGEIERLDFEQSILLGFKFPQDTSLGPFPTSCSSVFYSFTVLRSTINWKTNERKLILYVFREHSCIKITGFYNQSNTVHKKLWNWLGNQFCTSHFTRHAYFSKHLCNDVQNFIVSSFPDMIQMRCAFTEEIVFKW